MGISKIGQRHEVGKMWENVSADLLDSGLPQSFSLYKRQYL